MHLVGSIPGFGKAVRMGAHMDGKKCRAKQSVEGFRRQPWHAQLRVGQMDE